MRAHALRSERTYNRCVTELTIQIPPALEDQVRAGWITAEDLQNALFEAFTAAPVYTATTVGERAALLAGSGLDGDALARAQALADEEDRDPIAAAKRRSRVNAQAQVTATVRAKLDSLDTTEAARVVGKNATSITRWWREGLIVGFKDARGALRLPRWQFTEHGRLPGSEQVAASRGSLPLTALGAVMVTPTNELGGATPRDWLIEGGPVATVVSVLSGANNW